MDQIKIGNFIAQCRKEKGMTQNQLADILAISDKTVSKWETGKGIPDAGCMVPLCETLGISVNELLSGERIPKDEYRERAEETLVALAEMKSEVADVKSEMADVKSEMGNVKRKTISINEGVKKGISFGAALAMVISYHAYSSIGWAIFHGLLGWFYVIYYFIKYQ